MNRNIYDFLEKEKIPFSKKEPIRHHTSIKIGGRVDLLVTAASYDTLVKLLHYTDTSHQPYILLGGGSNVVFTDDPCRFMVILNRSNRIKKLNDRLIEVDSGTPNSHLMKWCVENSAGGLEFLAGIPGTVGGAAAVNAGAFGQAMEGAVAEGEMFQKGAGIRWVNHSHFDFSYRESNIKYSSQSILKLRLKCAPAPAEEILEKVKRNIQYRQANHPDYHRFTSGCFFKNPVIAGKKVSAGAILEELGFKGFSHDDLLLSDQHANFLINMGKATFADVIALEKKIKNKVARAKKIQLHREVIYISATGDKY